MPLEVSSQLGLGARFRSFFARRWTSRIGVLVVSLLIGVASSLLLQYSPFLLEANRTAYTAIQKRLGGMDKGTGALTLIDLSPLLAPRGRENITQGEVRPDGEVLSSKPQEEYRRQIVGLTDLLELTGGFKPLAIFVDWQVTIPRDLWDAQRADWASGVTSQFKGDYQRFIATMDALGKQGCEVFIVGDLVADLDAAGLPIAPGRRRDRFLLSSTLPRTDWYPMYPLAAMGKASLARQASVTDGLVDALEMDDLVAREPRKWGLFESTTRVGDQDCFWIDYGYATPLIREALFIDQTRFLVPEHQALLAQKLAGRIAFFADLTEPVAEDAIPIPVLAANTNVTLPDGSSADVRGSGGLAQACALLTRTQGPLYALPDGLPSTLFFLGVNVGVALFAWLLSGFLSALFGAALGTPAEVSVELIVLIAVTVVVLLYGIELMTRSRVLVPQIEGYLVTRFVDTVLLAAMLVWPTVNAAPSAEDS